ncbi:MAG TPA: DUF4097 family beta strand repeat-containing protein [Gemmatimonadaceae bacterium]|nr:DUF4097 family beta strand repeat-containing protein [Gemmatimonadaceae bacterium]
MRNPLLTLAIAAATAVPFSVGAAQQKVDIHRAASPTVSVRLNGAISVIRVVGWDKDSIALVGGIGAGSRLDGGPLNAVGPVQGMKFYVEAADEAGSRANRLELYVPARSRVWIKAGSADIEAGGVTGGLDLNIVGGSVRVSGAPRELLVESMDGSVTMNGTAEFARLKTATGDIVLQGGGEDVTLTTVSGSIRASDGTVQRARFESVTGPIVFAGDLARGGDAKFDTHSGAIELRLARRADLEIDAASITGSIENGWNSGRPIAGREGRGMELGTSSGMGGARVTIRSFKGNVKLAPK